MTVLFPGLNSEIRGVNVFGTIRRMLSINNFKTSFIIFKNGGGTLLLKMDFMKNRLDINDGFRSRDDRIKFYFDGTESCALLCLGLLDYSTTSKSDGKTIS